jgi:hypothetical protein
MAINRAIYSYSWFVGYSIAYLITIVYLRVIAVTFLWALKDESF